MKKRSHLGMAGHYAAMSEFLYRGYNVAVPAVDVGDDVYVVEDQQGAMWRLQIKTSENNTYLLSRRQLREPKANELFFMFMKRSETRWRFVLIPRQKLSDLRDDFEAAPKAGKKGPKPKADRDAKDGLSLKMKWSSSDAECWGASLAEFLEKWPEQFPERPNGPGAVSKN